MLFHQWSFLGLYFYDCSIKTFKRPLKIIILLFLKYKLILSRAGHFHFHLLSFINYMFCFFLVLLVQLSLLEKLWACACVHHHFEHQFVDFSYNFRFLRVYMISHSSMTIVPIVTKVRPVKEKFRGTLRF